MTALWIVLAFVGGFYLGGLAMARVSYIHAAREANPDWVWRDGKWRRHSE